MGSMKFSLILNNEFMYSTISTKYLAWLFFVYRGFMSPHVMRLLDIDTGRTG